MVGKEVESSTRGDSNAETKGGKNEESENRVKNCVHQRPQKPSSRQEKKNENILHEKISGSISST